MTREPPLSTSDTKGIAKLLKSVLRPGALHTGYCPICEGRTVFAKTDSWLRDNYLCLRCRSIPRFRALICVLQTHFPGWRELAIHESSPGSPSSDKLKGECKGYVGTQFFPDVPPGGFRQGFRCENLEHQTFEDGRFDLVVTQDVFEHLLHPARAFSEISRTLKKGGAHVFTVPWYYWQETVIRAVEENGTIRHLKAPDYHSNPIDEKGSLVVTEWGWDLCDFIYESSGMTTTAIRISDKHQGIDAQFIEVFVSRKTR
jgi:hypothetical protein